MAAACRLNSGNIEEKNGTDKNENFCVVNVLCVFVSLVSVLADLTTDILVFAEYCKDGYTFWALGTIIFILSPNILINIFSMRWYIIDNKNNIKLWIVHGGLTGFFERFFTFLYEVFKCKNLESLITQTLVSQRNDLCLLHFLYVFTGTVPQIILQSYAIITLDEINYSTKAFSVIASTASLIWSCSSYIYNIMVFSNKPYKWETVFLKLIWHFCMLVARLSGILLFSLIFGTWTLVPLGLHWFAMTFWILTQNTTFCPNKLEETLYNVVMGFVYCFTYINLREGNTRYRIMMFYTLMMTQNFGSLLLYLLITDPDRQTKSWSIAAVACIVAGTLIGTCSMILYYRYFHSKGPITWNKYKDEELNNKTISEFVNGINNQGNAIQNIRAFKCLQKSKKVEANMSNERICNNQVSQSNIDSADKKFLLEHWIARSGTPTFTSAPIGNNCSMEISSIEIHTVENTPQSVEIGRNISRGVSHMQNNLKKKSLCSPTMLTLKLSSLENDDKTDNAIQAKQRRRGICSSDDLRNNLELRNDDYVKSTKTEHSSEGSHDTESSNKKTSSDSIDMDLDLSFSDINSSDINTFNENIVQKLCLSALKNIKVGNQDADIENIQRIALDILKEMYTKKGKNDSCVSKELLSPKSRDLETPTENLSVHDYENICAVNIAREAWGLRSWNGYCDIENWLHDGSVVRERRNDTYTSGSSEISSCKSHELKNAILTASSVPKKSHTYSNVLVKFDRCHMEEYCNTMNFHSNDETCAFKTYAVDNKDQNQLEPILEELDDLGDMEIFHKKRLNSESSLVATIDEIRNSTATNSPTQYYHRREKFWNSPQFENNTNENVHFENVLMKEPYKFDSVNIMESLPEKENIWNVVQESKLDLINKGFCNSALPFSDNVTRNNKKNKRHQNDYSVKGNIDPDGSKKKLHDLSNTDIDLLWQIVSENSLPNSNDQLFYNRRSTSMQSLIHKDKVSFDNTSSQIPKVTNLKKGNRSRPRRKFSILREKFEPRIHSDEESLYISTKCMSKTYDLNTTKNILVQNITQESNSSQLKEISLPALNMKPTDINEQQSSSSQSNVKEKRSLFMKQVLSPPKFNTKLRYKL